MTSMSQPLAPLQNVLIVDDHSIVREGLKKIIGDSGQFTISADVESGLLAIQRVRDTAIDLVLLDISLPDKNGIDVLKQIKKECPSLPVLILSLHPENHYAVRALQAGASGYVNKKSTSTELLNAMHTAISGLKFITPTLAQELAHGLNKDRSRALHASLSDREYQTLIMIGSGKTVTEIAQQLTLSVKTISMYRSRLLQKMSLRNNAELTHYALRNQLVPDLT